jgi:hypothetical protein
LSSRALTVGSGQRSGHGHGSASVRLCAVTVKGQLRGGVPTAEDAAAAGSTGEASALHPDGSSGTMRPLPSLHFCFEFSHSQVTDGAEHVAHFRCLALYALSALDRVRVSQSRRCACRVSLTQPFTHSNSLFLSSSHCSCRRDGARETQRGVQVTCRRRASGPARSVSCCERVLEETPPRGCAPKHPPHP